MLWIKCMLLLLYVIEWPNFDFFDWFWLWNVPANSWEISSAVDNYSPFNVNDMTFVLTKKFWMWKNITWTLSSDNFDMGQDAWIDYNISAYFFDWQWQTPSCIHALVWGLLLSLFEIISQKYAYHHRWSCEAMAVREKIHHLQKCLCNKLWLTANSTTSIK